MFSSYAEFVGESNEDILSLAESMVNEDHLSELLDGCEEGKHIHIQMSINQGASSYVTIAIDDKFSISRVYQTSDPRAALVAIIMDSSGARTPKRVREIVTQRNPTVRYTVFPGKKALTQKEIAARYNFGIMSSPDKGISLMTSPPIVKNY